MKQKTVNAGDDEVTRAGPAIPKINFAWLKEDAIAEDTLLISDSLLTNSEQGEHTTSDPAPIINDEISLARSTIATIPNDISPVSNPNPPPSSCDTHNSTLRYQNLHHTLC